MNYIYDIVLNLNEVLYDQFDWSNKDKIERVKRIPIYRIEENDLRNIISNKINMDIKNIKNKTEFYNNRNRTCLLLTDSYNIICIEFDNKGNSINKSFLDIFEEEDVLSISNKFKEVNIEYKILGQDKVFFKTRNEYKKLNYINNELNNISNSKLKYLYFECSNMELNDLDNIKKNIKKILNTPEDIKYKRLIETLELIENKK